MVISHSTILVLGTIASVCYLLDDSRKELEFVLAALAFLAYTTFFIYQGFRSGYSSPRGDPPPVHTSADTPLEGVNLGWSIDRDLASHVIFTRRNYKVAFSKPSKVLRLLSPSVDRDFRTFYEVEEWLSDNP